MWVGGCRSFGPSLIASFPVSSRYQPSLPLSSTVQYLLEVTYLLKLIFTTAAQERDLLIDRHSRQAHKPHDGLLCNKLQSCFSRVHHLHSRSTHVPLSPSVHLLLSDTTIFLDYLPDGHRGCDCGVVCEHHDFSAHLLCAALFGALALVVACFPTVQIQPPEDVS